MTAKLYVIEDDAATVMLLKRYVSRAAWDVELIHFEYGSDALAQLLEDDSASVLLLDLNLPDMHGIAILEAIRQSERHSKLPVIVLTTSNLEHERTRCLELGVNHFLEKPFNFDELISLLQALDVSFLTT